ncbi:MAG: hypothetical protein AB7E05_05615 [Sphingobium sp.]
MSDRKAHPAQRLAALDLRTRDQRQRVQSLARIAQDRLRPAHLAQEAGNRALDLGLDTIAKAKAAARAHPGKTAALVAVIGAAIARKPLLRLIGKGYGTVRDRLNLKR